MRPLTLAALLLPFLVLSCSLTSTTGPGDDPIAGGSFDPDAESFVLERIVTTSPDLEPVIVELVGSNVVVDSSGETVSVDVAIRNVGEHALHPPATIWLGEFRPRDVRPINADVLLPTEGPIDDTWGYLYDDTFGNDGVLTPGETSDKRLWRFHDPGGRPFSFAIGGEFSTAPGASISGMAFIDRNQNGVRDPDEEPFETGWLVRLTTPDGEGLETEPREGGRYAFRVDRPGLYRVEFIVLIEPVYCVTTSNPLEVLLTPGPDGGPRSFENADFGFAFGPCNEPLAPVMLSDLEPSEIEPQDPYALDELRVAGDLLILRIGFSGCSPDHPFELYAADELLWPVPEDELPPLVPWMVLSHDDRDEPCDAYFVRTLAFDLSPLSQLHEGPMNVHFHDAAGGIHEFVYEP